MHGPAENAARLPAVTRVPFAAGILLALFSCRSKQDAPTSPSPDGAATGSVSAATPVSAPASTASSITAPPSAVPLARPPAASAASPAPYAPDPQRYAWLAGNRNFPRPDASLERRFAVPPGYQRVKVEPGSFAEWLRGLPMAPEGTPVKSWDGKETLGAADDYLAGVVAIDVGNADLQQSSDVIIRLHAEYLWSRQQKDQITYLSATKLSMPLSRWEKGQRLIASGPNVFWAVKGKPSEIDYDEFRRYLDAVFNWANSTSLSSRSTPVADAKDLVPGDFFVQSREPNHVVVVLDLAEKPSGERVALLGQARNPAESVHVLRPGQATAWFSVRPPVPVMTPHSKALSWSELRRMTSAVENP